MSAASWPIELDLRLLMLCPARPDGRDIRRLARDLGCSRANVRRRRRTLRKGARARAGLGGGR